MDEKLYTIPLNDAVNANDECPFCYIERLVEQNSLDFVLGNSSSYMESDIRDQTDRAGFCKIHTKKMFDYGNTLGNALILKTHYKYVHREMTEAFKNFAPGKISLRERFSKKPVSTDKNSVASWIAGRDSSCYICDNIRQTLNRYWSTFFFLYKKEPSFRQKVLEGKGFCLTHFGELCTYADRELNEKEKSEFYPAVFELMERNMTRMEEDISWLVDKFDYRNRDADWRNSKDALQRGMQKLHGGYPADPVHKAK